MEEIIVAKEELVDMFIEGKIKDGKDGWLYKDSIIVSIVALHDKDPKYIYDITNADYYKIVPIREV